MKVLIIIVGLIVVGSLLNTNSKSRLDDPTNNVVVPNGPLDSAEKIEADQAARIHKAKEVARTALFSWRVTTSTSPIDDSTNVQMRIISTTNIAGRFGQSGPATMVIMCMENKSTVYFQLNNLFLSDIQSYGNVTYRVDKKQAKTRQMKASTDNGALGLWGGGASIPFIKSLFGYEKLLVQVTPFNESPVMVTFNISGVEKKIEPLRKACNW